MPSDLLEVVAAYSPVAATTLTQPVRLGETLTDAFGLLIEEYTTNLATNGCLELGAATYWGGTNGSAAYDATMTVFGHGSVKWTAAANGVAGIYITSDGARIPVTPGATYTFSVWVYTNAVGRHVYVGMDWYNETGYSSAASGPQTVVNAGGWQRFSYTATVPTTGRVLYATPRAYFADAQAGDAFWYDGAQFEAKPYPTTTASGSMGSGYAYDAAGNGISNPSFETNLNGWSSSDPGFGPLVRTTAFHQDGAYSAAFVGGARTTVNTAAQNSYALSAYVKAAAAAATGIYLGSTAFPTPSVESGPGRRYAMAANGPGLFVEESSTNLLLSPSAENGYPAPTVSGLTTVGPIGGGTIAISADSTFAFIGSASFKVSTDGTVGAQGVSLSSAEGQPAGSYTGSVWVYAAAGTFLQIFLRGTYSDTTFVQQTATITTSGTGWQKVTTAALTTTKAAILYLMVRSSNTATPVVFWADAAQVEPKAYATTYADGGLGTGYSYDAPTHTIPNPAFEGGFQANGVPTSWSIGASATAVSAGGYANLGGSYSVQFSSSIAGNGSNNRLSSSALSPALAANTTYTVSFYARRISGTGELQVSIDSAGTNLASTNFAAAANPTGWYRYAGTFTTSATTPSNSINFYATVAGDVFQIDGVQIEARAYATPFGASATAGTTTSSRAYGYEEFPISGNPAMSPVSMVATLKISETMNGAGTGTDQHVLDLSHSGNPTETVRIIFYHQQTVEAQIYANGASIGVATLAQAVNVGDTLAVGMTYDGARIYIYSCANGGVVNSSSIAATSSFVSGANRVAIGSNPYNNTGAINNAIENAMIFNTALDATTMSNILNGTTLPSSAAGRSDCIWSALVNNPDPTGSPWRGTSSSGFQRYSQVRSTVKGETVTDIVVLAYPGTAAAVGNAAWLDAVQWEHRDHVTPYGAIASAGSTTTRSEGKAQFNLASTISNAPWTAMAFVRPQQASSAFTAKHIWLSSVAGLWVGANAGTGIGSDIGASALPITWAAGDTLWVAISHDGSGNMTAWAANVTQGTGPAFTSGTTAFTTAMSGVLVGCYTSSGYGADAIVGPVTVLDRALTGPADAFRYAQGLGAIPDPTEDRAVVAQVGYGGAAYAEKIWQASPTATAVPAAPGFLQVIGSYTGDVSTTDNSGNALPSGQLRFTVPGSAAPVDTGQLVQVIDSTGRYGAGDQWTVTSISDLTPGEVDLLLTHI